MSTTPNTPFDPGLQPERTALAWRRTGLAMAVGSLLALRVVPIYLGASSLIPVVAGLVASVAILVTSQVRYRRQTVRLSDHDDRIGVAHGALVALTALTTVLFAGVAMLVVVVSAISPG